MWTQFWDMHSGGSTKLPPHNKIYIEGHERLARMVFTRKFDRDPDHVTCDCCGADYSVSEGDSIESLAHWCREWNGKEYVRTREWSLSEYVEDTDALVITKEDVLGEFLEFQELYTLSPESWDTIEACIRDRY